MAERLSRKPTEKAENTIMRRQELGNLSLPEIVLRSMDEFKLKSTIVANILGISIETIQEKIIEFASKLPLEENHKVFEFLRVQDKQLPIFKPRSTYDGETLHKLLSGFNRLDVITFTKVSQRVMTKRILEYAKSTEKTEEIVQKYCELSVTNIFEFVPVYLRTSWDDKTFAKMYNLQPSDMKLILEIVGFMPRVICQDDNASTEGRKYVPHTRVFRTVLKW